MAKKRIRIPPHLADVVIFQADQTCCICRRKDSALQIHHLDGDPANNSLENLAALCLDDHHKASMRSPIARTLSPGVITKYRDEWNSLVKQKREVAVAKIDGAIGTHETIMEAIACHEVRKISFTLGAKWDVVEEGLTQIAPYATWTSRDYSDNLRAEILDCLYTLSTRTRAGMPVSVSRILCGLVTDSLPITSLVSPARTKLTDRQCELLITGTVTGFGVAHDGIKYLEDLRVMADGTRVLWTVLRYCRLNDLPGVRAECIRDFESLGKTAELAGNDKAKRWLEFERADALALDDEPLPALPKDIYAEITGMPRSLDEL